MKHSTPPAGVVGWRYPVEDFEAIRAEAVAAKLARDEAEARYRVAADALMAAQCWVHYADSYDRPGYTTRHYCTLRKGHIGDHGKADT